MPCQHRGRGAFDFTSRDEPGPDNALPKLPQQCAPDRRKADRDRSPDRDPIEPSQFRISELSVFKIIRKSD
jgi:hypothetical protein